MKLTARLTRADCPSVDFPSAKAAGSVLVIVLWVALGLVTITLYFASSMSFELRASDNRVSALAADQSIEGAARYVQSVLSTLSTNGTVPDLASYQSAAVPVGDSHFWLIGRAGDYQQQTQPEQVFFGLIDEGSKLNLNTATASMLDLLTNMTLELAANIADWRDTNGNTSANGDGPTVYSQFQPPYLCKNAPFETLDEVRLVYSSDLGSLLGEDLNRNGALDPSEIDTNRNNLVDPGILEYLTVYSREPNTSRGGGSRVNIRNPNSGAEPLRALLSTNLSSSARVNAILNQYRPTGPGPSRPGQGNPGPPPASPPYTSPLDFYLRMRAPPASMTADEFALIAPSLTVSGATYMYGRVNINTATAAVLSCLPGMTSDLAQQLVSYRQQNPSKLTSLAWLVEALGQNNNTVLQALAAGDYLTTQSYQFTADIAALGPYGRGYRRVKFIFDTSTGAPRIIYRQDLTHLGWGLGKYVRQAWLMAQNTR